MALSDKDETNIGQELRATLDRATMSYLARVLTDGEDWARVRSVNDQFDERRDTLARELESDYDQRVSEARAKLLAETIKSELDHPAPPGFAARTEESINGAAHRAVMRDHLDALQAAIQERRVSLDAIVAEVHARDSPQSEVRTSFERASTQSEVSPPGSGQKIQPRLRRLRNVHHRKDDADRHLKADRSNEACSLETGLSKNRKIFLALGGFDGIMFLFCSNSKRRKR